LTMAREQRGFRIAGALRSYNGPAFPLAPPPLFAENQGGSVICFE
jgi:hypothetical protein